ncbi:hypothetical protein BGZ61DRAFT_442288 [Ilyonectria robusta]|uniref:uncharacterized protein n=1 Tax=Ilyonectria robusta TaxID=1079257 RepID=UPI001E8E7CB7|nr:uncharacterized protein BGZ61DRAFT_442288 [Ilyonectria robusta]KAH8734210.1 hypothetical protein BGZ61DRAFT_442288 [Ilyonectria robusta]
MGASSPGPLPLLVSGWLLTGIAAVAIIARLYLRLIIQKRKLLYSDWFICASWICGTITNVMNTELAHLGAFDKHVMMTLDGYRGDPDNIDMIIKLLVLSHIPLWSTFYLCKAALLAAYLQLFLEFMKKRKIFLWATMAYNVAAYLASIIVLLCVCEPEDDWSLSLPGSCAINYGESIFLISWALHFFGDILVFALPWLIVPSMGLKTSLKVGVYCTFLLGGITMIICIVRLVTLEASEVRNNLSLSLMVLWNTLECGMGVIIACLPSLRPYLHDKNVTTSETVKTSSRTSNPGPRCQSGSYSSTASPEGV